MTRRLLAALGALLAVLLTPGIAQASVSKVSLTQNGPSPSTVTIKVGDTVAFTNTDSVTHTLRSTSSNWTFSATVAAKATKSVTFPKPGTFDYSDTYNNILGLPQTAAGHVVVPKPQPSPTPSASPSSRPQPSATATARPYGSASPSAVPTSSGVALPPPIIGGGVPTPSATPSVGPVPQVAPGGVRPTSVSTSPAAQVEYANPHEIVQGSAHGFGLPAALAVVAAVGVVTLLVRILLAAPEAGRHAEPEVR